MTIQLPKLPYKMNALVPFISEETLNYHYGKHHAAYVKNMNNLIEGTPLADKGLIDVILTAASDTVLTGVFNNAAQCFNHEFYWKSLTPQKQAVPSELEQLFIRDFGSVETFKKEFHKAAAGRFGSGWAWLVVDRNNHLSIVTTGNAETPVTKSDVTPLLCVDVWEHAYYLDYQNRRPDYLTAVIDHLLNWEFALHNLKKIKGE